MTTDTTTQETLTPATLAGLSRQSATANLWAARRIAAWLADKPAELFTRPVPSSFPSLADTILHITSIETMWLHNLRGQEYAFEYGQKYAGGIPELLAAYVASAEALLAHVESLSDEDLQGPCHFRIPVRWPEFEDFERPRYLIVQHCLIHGAYHRGQITTIGHNLGLTGAPITDFIAWLLTGQM